MEPSGFAEGACAVCGWSTPRQQLHLLSPSREMLRMLRNNCLPAHVLPDAYNVELYEGAILCFHGMTSLEAIGPLRVCHTCHSSLQSFPPQQPRYALANFLYYGTEKIPEDVRDAFATASPFDLCLVSRCRSSIVTHHFVRGGTRVGYVAEEARQGFSRGNVAIFPQNSLQLQTVLPPSGDDIRNTICVLFSRCRQAPTIEMLKRFGPVLVNKQKVEWMIKFLVANNEWYQADDIRFSPDNFQQLFHPADAESDIGVLQYMQVEYDAEHALDNGKEIWDDAQQ